jgi:hypothetical protein
MRVVKRQEEESGKSDLSRYRRVANVVWGQTALWGNLVARPYACAGL